MCDVIHAETDCSKTVSLVVSGECIHKLDIYFCECFHLVLQGAWEGGGSEVWRYVWVPDRSDVLQAVKWTVGVLPLATGQRSQYYIFSLGDMCGNLQSRQHYIKF